MVRSFLLASTALLALGTTALADDIALTGSVSLTSVPAVVHEEDKSAATVLSPGLTRTVAAEGKMPVENPTDLITHYGFAGDGPLSPAEGDVQAKGHNVEATKTEPDKNTYLVLTGQKGPDAAYDYGSHFLFQGHESGPKNKDGKTQGALTRINLDADEAHRVTLMATETEAGEPVPTIDGSTWNPFAKVLLLTSEEGADGGVWQATADFPSKVLDVSGSMGRASYEGVQLASDGSIWLVEDESGKGGEKTSHAKQPVGFLYRFVPTDKTDLTKGGVLQALQVSGPDGQPVVFHDGKKDEDILSDGMKALHTYGQTFKTRWLTIHDTAKDGSEPFDANAAAKAAMASPFKRPENGQFRPDTGFKEFVFTETGDTNAKSEAGAEHGGFGGIFKITQASPSADEGELALVYRGDLEHTGLDNLSFLTKDHLAAVEDAGSKVHGQRKAYDSAYVIDFTADYGKPDAAKPVRFIAEGRDKAATMDAKLAALENNGFQNDDDNEITGIHISDGDASVEGLIGTKAPVAFADSWRVFYTQQHGDNITYELSAKK